jgi:hypothetical protein
MRKADYYQILEQYSKSELIEQIIQFIKTNEEIRKYYQDNKIDCKNDNHKKLKEYKQIILDEYFPDSEEIGNPNQKNIKRIIGEIKNGKYEISDVIELLLFNVENGVKYANEYGDIDDQFYDGVADAFNEAIKLIRKTKEMDKYKERCEKVVIETDGIGWGFHDELADCYYSCYERQNKTKAKKKSG